MGLSGAKDEDDVFRRFLQRLEEGVGSGVGQHMGFVYDVDLTAALHRGEVHLVADVAYLVYAPVAGRVQFDDVHEAAVVDGLADGAGVAGVSVLEVEAVGGLGDDAGGGGLAAASRPAEQVGMGNPPQPHRLAQGGGDVLLPGQLVEAGRTPLAIVNLRRHGSGQLPFVLSLSKDSDLSAFRSRSCISAVSSGSTWS